MARGKTFQIRLSDEEFALFSSAAKSCSLSLAAWFRLIAQGHIGDRKYWVSHADAPIHPETDADYRESIIEYLQSAWDSLKSVIKADKFDLVLTGVMTATGHDLDKIGAEYGIFRIAIERAQKATRALTEGKMRKGGINQPNSQIQKRPPSPASMRVKP